MKLRAILATLAFIAVSSIGAFAQSGKTTGPQTVRDTDRPTKQPFFVKTYTNFSELVTVPAGKVLVIESVSGYVNATGLPGAFDLYASGSDGVVMSQIVAPSFHNSADTRTYYTHQGRYYIQAGNTLHVSWFATGNSVLGNMYLAVSGYYVDEQ